jgi:hypothetical protein
VAAGLTGFGVHCGNGVADDDGVGLKKPLAGGTSSDETALNGVASEPLAVVATADLPELALLVDLFMILSLDA